MGEMDPQNPTAFRLVTRLAGVVSIVCALTCTGLLSVRELVNTDLGYHLAYGDEFWETGKPVDGNDYIYTVKTAPRTGELTDVPGCYYDADGVYRFPNANWGTQAIMSAVNLAAGPVGLCVLQSVLVMGIFALILASILRWRLPPVLCAATILITTAVSHERFNLRPEVFGYLILAAQFYVLSGLYWPGEGGGGRRITWRGALVLVLLQLLLVNLHSYFMLGLALTSAVLAEHAFRAGWNKFVIPTSNTDASRRVMRYMLIVLAGQLAVCFANPWTWRIAILPIQTLVYLKQNQIAAGPQISSHPWATIGELFRPFATKTYLPGASLHMLVAVLVFAVPAAIVASAKRRWAMLLLLAGTVLVATSVRRNIAAGGLLLTPVVALLLWAGVKHLLGAIRPSQRIGSTAGVILAMTVVAASTAGSFLIVTNRLYYIQRTPLRFGVGLSHMQLPTDAAAWMNTHKPKGRLWCGLNSSSNIHYLVDSQPEVPVLSNTWAYPPIVMREVLDYTQGKRDFREVMDRYRVQIVVLRADRLNARLVRRLAADTDHWALVDLTGRHLLFLRKDGPNAQLASQAELTDVTFDLDACIAHMNRLDSKRPNISLMTGQVAFRMGWNRVAVALTGRATKLDPNFHEAWNLLGLSILQQGSARLEPERALLRRMRKRLNDMKKPPQRDTHKLAEYRLEWAKLKLAATKLNLKMVAPYRDCLLEGRKCFEKSLELEPSYREAADHLIKVSQQLRDLQLQVLPETRFR